jgi:CheY-like chemotaxis protein
MAANRKIMGTGLGMPIAKTLVEMMDGHIEVASKYGEGTTFTVRLKQKYVSDEVISPEVIESLIGFNYSLKKSRQYRGKERIKMPYASVLVVDDVTTNLDVVKGLLKPYNMKIDCVKSGQEAIDAIRDENVHYNAIFMDHMMPVMDGVEAVHLIREIDTDYAKNIPIIALTANAIVGCEEMFLENGFQDFISKPIDIAVLDVAVNKWVRDLEQEKLLGLTYLQESVEDERDDKNWHVLYNGITGINIEKGLQSFAGDKGAYLEVLKSFAKNTQPLIESSKEVSKDKLLEYETVVHGIKGSSRSISAEEVGNLAESLEKAALNGNYDFIIANNDKLAEKIRVLISDIDRMIKQFEADNLKQQKDKPDDETLMKLRRACIDYDMSEVDAALEELESFSYETNGDLVIWLRESVEQASFDDIIERLS